MKKTLGVKKISVKMNGRESGAYRVFAESMSASRKLIADPGLTAYQLPDGTILEFYNEGALYPSYLFSLADVVISYKVNSLEKTVASLKETGAELLSQENEPDDAYRFCYLKIDDQQIIGIYED